jgi:ligand-binding sensor domain-containing protein/signal transduction histidine kinase
MRSFLRLRCAFGRGLLLLPALLVMAPAARAERVQVKWYSTQDGLAHFSVNRIVMDSRGYVWIGTREGLSRFDGYAFTNFGVADGLPSANVSDIVETPEGLYWIGTLEGLVLFDPDAPVSNDVSPGRRSRFTVIPRPGDSRTAAITGLARDTHGTLWVGTGDGLFKVDSSPDVPRMVEVDLDIADELDARSIQALTAGRDGSVWVAAGPGLFVWRPNGSMDTLLYSRDLPEQRIRQLFADGAGRIWAATTGGLWRLEYGGHGEILVADVAGVTEGTSEAPILSAVQATDGSFWVGTVSGLARGRSADGRQVRFEQVRSAEGPPLRAISALAEDAGGDLWVGTSTEGLFRVPLTGFRLLGADDGLESARGVTPTADGNVAVFAAAGDRWSIYCSDGRHLRQVRPGGNLGIATWAWNQIMLQDSRGDWWIGTGSGVFRFTGAPSCAGLERRPPADHFHSGNGLAADVVIRLFEDSRGDVWIATVGHGVRPDGLSRWNRRTATMEKFDDGPGLPTFERHYVSSFAEDRAGNVWLGFSRDGGMARYRNGRFERFTKEHGVPPGQIRNMALDDGGRIWAASFRAGVVRVDDPAAATPRFQSYTTAEGLSSNETYAIVADAAGKVFVASARGIDRLDPVTGLVRRYSQADGVPFTEFHGAFRDRHGTLWFTHEAGVSLFTPSTERTGRPPRVLITALSVNGEPQPLSALGERSVAPLSVPHQRNTLQVGFVATGTRAAGDYLYRYKLENASEEWSRFADTRTLTFANLSPGEYRLLIEARTIDGAVSESPATLSFTIVPPVWQRRWFVGLALAIAAGAGYGLHRVRLRRLLEITRIRDRIAADLHDDLGANLTKIAVLGEAARRQATPADGALSSMATIARESVANMSDIVWAIDPGRDTLEDLVRKMREHASETFALGDVELVFDAAPRPDPRHIGIELRHDLFLLFKEAINNAARHAQARRVEVRFAVNGSTVVLRICDDGVGMDLASAPEGHGLGSLRKRAARMGGRLEIASAPGAGTRVDVTVPLRG